MTPSPESGLFNRIKQMSAGCYDKFAAATSSGRLRRGRIELK
jgi:hypothetical protein